MPTIKVSDQDYKNPAELVDKLVAGQQFPFTLSFKHFRKDGAVIPSAKVYDVVPPATDFKLEVWDYRQVWEVVVMLSHNMEVFKGIEPAEVTSPAGEKTPIEKPFDSAGAPDSEATHADEQDADSQAAKRNK